MKIEFEEFSAIEDEYIIMSYGPDVCCFLPVVQKISLMRKIF